MLGTHAFQHRLFRVGALFKCAYLFAAFGIIYLFWNTNHAQSEQVTTRSLHGEVIDERSRARLEEVVVYITGLEKRVRTDTNGQFQFDAVPEGEYKLQFTKTDYQQLEQVIDVNSATPYIQIELKTLAYS